MSVFASDGHLRPAEALAMRNHANIHPFSL